MRAMFSQPLSPRSVARVLVTSVTLSLTMGAALAAVVVAMVFASVISAAPASAHAALVKITPEADAHLTTAPTEVMLEFDEPVSATFAAVVVTTAAGVTVVRGRPRVQGAKVTQALSPEMVSGSYRVAYRVVSNDGHPVSGESRFTLTLTSGPSPATLGGTPGASASASSGPPTPSAPALARPPTNSPEPGQAGWLSRSLVPIGGAAGLLVVGGGVLLWARQRR
jgi:methionine-rich copper-binding protein CopC